MGTAEGRDLLDREEHSRLIVCPHDADQCGLFGEGCRQCLHIQAPVMIHLYLNNLNSLPRQSLAKLPGGRCSTVLVIIRLRGDRDIRRLRRTVLIDSVPPLVNRISSTAHLSRPATCDLAISTPRRACCPNRCMLEGLPHHSSKYGSITSTTSGAGIVVALLSRYTMSIETLYADRFACL